MLVISRVRNFFPLAGWSACQALVDAPGDPERGMLLVGEHLPEPALLLLGQQPSPGPSHASDVVEQITAVPPMRVRQETLGLPSSR